MEAVRSEKPLSADETPEIRGDRSRAGRGAGLLTSLALVLLTLAAFAPLCGRGYDFVNVDDQDYVTDNPHVLGGLSPANIGWAFTSFHAYNWHPLTWLSLQCDAQFFGATATSFHRTNLAMHIVNVLLLFWALTRLTGALGRSAAVAALFAVHPLHVESVAWIAERKDVLSTTFWMLTLLAYAAYTARPGLLRYLAVVLAFALGLMAKPMLVTLPFVLLLLDYWPLGRWSRALHLAGGAGYHAAARLILEKVPLLLLSAASSVMTMFAQKRIVKSADQFTVPARLSNAVLAYFVYIRKMVWPANLTIFYPHAHGAVPLWLVVGVGGLLLGISVLVIVLARRHGYLPVGWFWYVGTLIPVIGLVQVGNQAYADRYTYVPLIGLFIAVAWGVAELAERWRWPAAVPGGVAVIVVVACAVLTTRQVAYWHDSVALWRRATRLMWPVHPIPHFQLGLAYETAGNLDKARDQYEKALALHPDYPGVHNHIGKILQEQGDLPGAWTEFQKELQLNPDSFQAQTGLGEILEQANDLDGARRRYAEALRLQDDEVTHTNLGRVLRRQGKLAEAHAEFTAALALAPASAEAHNNLGLVLEDEGKMSAALPYYREAVRLDSLKPQYHCNLALALAASGDAEAARAEYRLALLQDPTWPERFAESAWAFATDPRVEVRNGRIALHLAKQACQAVAAPPASSLDALAAAQAESGDFRSAVSTAEQAKRAAQSEGERRLAADIDGRMQQYRQHRSYHPGGDR